VKSAFIDISRAHPGQPWAIAIFVRKAASDADIPNNKNLCI